jgi:5-methylthioribose kinase
MPIKEFFKEKGYLDAEIINERIGLLNLVYTIKAGSEIFFYKKPEKTSELSSNLSTERIINEFKALELARKVIPENIPEIFYFDETEKILITKGPPEKSSILRFDLLDGNLDIKLIKNIAKSIKLVHSIKQGDLHRELFDKVKIGFLYNQLAKEYPHVIHKLLDNVNTEKCLVHADFNPKNIIVFGDHNFYIIDWEQALISSPEQDIANMLAHYIIKGIHLGREDYLTVPKIFLKAYGDGVDINIINGHIGVTMWGRINTSAKARYLTPETSQKVLEVAHKYLKEFEV